MRTGPGWWGSPRSVPLKRAGLPHRPCGTAPGAARRPPGRPPGHSGGGPDPDGTGQPVHQRHPQPAGGGGGGGHLPLQALKIYVCNIMTQEGETEGYTAADHVDALLSHGAPGLVDLCLANSAPVRPGLVEKYREEDAAPILVDRERIRAMGLELEGDPVASEGATMPATTRTGWRRRCWTCTAGGRCASSGANSGTSLRRRPCPLQERPRGAVPDGAEPEMLHPGGGIRRSALLQHLFRAGDPHHHGERGICPAAPYPVPQGVPPLL